jgi:hypothetical protein
VEVEKSNHVLLQLLTSVLFHATLDVSGIVAWKGDWPHEQPELLGLWLILSWFLLLSRRTTTFTNQKFVC